MKNLRHFDKFQEEVKIVTKFWLKPIKFLQNIYTWTISFDKFPSLLELSPCDCNFVTVKEWQQNLTLKQQLLTLSNPFLAK